MSNTLTVRRGAHVLTLLSRDCGVAMIEGTAHLLGRTWNVLRYADGTVGYATNDIAAPVDGATRLVSDDGNNVGRLCNVRGDAVQGHPARCWAVHAAVSGSRYLVAHLDTDAVRVVDHREMTNLY